MNNANTATQICPDCNKSFKNLRLHIVKAHEKIVVEIPDFSWCAAEDCDDWIIPRVKYNGVLCEATDSWGGESFTTQIYEFPKALSAQNKDTYFGIQITFSPAGRVLHGEYCKQTAGTIATEPISFARITTVSHF